MAKLRCVNDRLEDEEGNVLAHETKKGVFDKLINGIVEGTHGFCPVCGGYVPLEEGIFRSHYAQGTEPRERCPGSDQPTPYAAGPEIA
jgi:hypothetical protein